MGTTILSGLLLLVLAGFAWFYAFHRARIRELEQARADIESEEHRVFDFLHGLGEAFTEEIQVGSLHRLIVEGAVRILGAHGGALYLVHREGNYLVPSYLTKGVPPLVEIPRHIVRQSANTPKAIDSYVNLHPVKRGEGVLGRIWHEEEGCFLPRVSQEPALEANRSLNNHAESAMIVPLLYAGQNLGVLAIANGPMGKPFRDSDYIVFKSIAEQSAFALYNAMIYSEISEKKRIDHDLEIARDIQRILLPSDAPKIENYTISGLNIPARQVSGDYYDYIRVDEERVGVAIADVSGKGVPASLIMAMCRSVLRSQAVGNPSAADVLHKVNRQLFPDIKEDMFISMAYLILNRKTNEAVLARAGHDAPLLYSASEKKVVKVNPPGMAVGIDSGDVFDRITGDFSVKLQEGDCLVLYTDGVTEAQDRGGFEYGLQKMTHVIRAYAPEGAESLVQQLSEDVNEFVGNHPQHDDITLIAIQKS